MPELGLQLTDDGGLALTVLVSRAEVESLGLTPVPSADPVPASPVAEPASPEPPFEGEQPAPSVEPPAPSV